MSNFKAMSKSDVRYEAKVEVAKLEDLKRSLVIGPILHEREIKAAIRSARNSDTLTAGYVKAGIVGKDLVFRIKGKIAGKTGHFGDADIVVYKGYKQIEAAVLIRKASALRALDALFTDLSGSVDSKLVRAAADLDRASAALDGANHQAAVWHHGTAANDLKGVHQECTRRGSEQKAAAYLRLEGAEPGDLRMPSETLAKKADLYRKVSANFAKRYADLQDRCVAVAVRLSQIDQELSNADTSGASQDGAYNRALKDAMDEVSAVLQTAKAALVRSKGAYSRIATLDVAISRTTAVTADALAAKIGKLRDTLVDEYTTVDAHIEGTIRRDDGPWASRVRAAGITPNDQMTYTTPLTRRCFAVNFELKSLSIDGEEALTDALEVLVEKFDSDVAQTLLQAWAKP